MHNPWPQLITQIQFEQQYQPKCFRGKPLTRYSISLLRDIHSAFTQLFGDCFDFEDFMDLVNQPLSQDELKTLKNECFLDQNKPKQPVKANFDNIFVNNKV